MIHVTLKRFNYLSLIRTVLNCTTALRLTISSTNRETAVGCVFRNGDLNREKFPNMRVIKDKPLYDLVVREEVSLGNSESNDL